MSTPLNEKHKAHLPSILRRSGRALVITILLIVVTHLIAYTPIGHSIETWTFAFLQRQLSPFESEERLPILVVDISNIPGGKDQHTSRDTIRQLIEAIAAQNPRAIAIDIDFSPSIDGWQDDDDPSFFDFCLNTSERIPIILGVYRTRAAPAKAWLGLNKYKDLAAAVLVNEENTIRVPRWIQQSGVPEKLPTISARLAEKYRPSLPEPNRLLRWLVEVSSDHHGIETSEHEIKLGEILVNYSKLEQIQHESVSTISPASIRDEGAKFYGKMVLLGDGTPPSDAFIVPGRTRPVAGVYLQACAAYTLAVEPLYEFTSAARHILDLMISLTIILGIEWIRFRTVKKRPGERFHTWSTRFLWIAVIFIFVSGILLIRWQNIMWLDFLLVIFAWLLHPRIEDKLSWFLKKPKGWRYSHTKE